MTRRGALTTGLWAVPVIAVAVAAPAAAASGDEVTLVWTPSSVPYSTVTRLILTVPENAPAVGQSGMLRILGSQGSAVVKAPRYPWIMAFPEGSLLLLFEPPAGSIPAGQFVFEIEFVQRQTGSVAYFAELVDSQGVRFAHTPPMAITD